MDIDPTALDDDTLAELAAHLADEQRRRARLRGDLDALVADAFDTLFDSAGTARTPHITHGIVLCPGSLTGSSQPGASHDCVFHHLTDADGDGHWVFEHPDRLSDTIRHTTVRGTAVQQSITALPAVEGLTISRIGSKARAGKHQRRSITTWAVHNGTLVDAHPAPAPTRHQH
jgi:hypothetical protein